MTDDQGEIVAFLSDPAAYGLGEGVIERHETHGSIVFLAGDRAYKLKRSVRFPYMDYSTAAQRRRMCEAELAVNRRLAPELYLGTVPVLKSNDGSLRIGGEGGSAVEWLVVMRRFDQAMLLEAMRRRNALDEPLMRALGERIAEFHLNAERRPEYGGAGAIAAVIDENRNLLGKALPDQAAKVGQLDRMARERLHDLHPLLDARRSSGFVRRCHGDLHLNNICVYENRPVPFDAIEFRDDFAYIDVLYDLALLLMDLDRHGLVGHANILFNRYLERTGDYEGLAALPLFLSCRAAMRAHVLLAMASFDPEGRTPRRVAEAARLLDLAITYLRPRRRGLVAIGGVSGTGKSTIAAMAAPHLGDTPGAIVIRTDIVRKTLWGAEELERLPPEAYEAQVTQRAYRTVAARAKAALGAGFFVIADAVFGSPQERAQIEAAASKCNARFCGIWLGAPSPLLERRLLDRRNDASDATAAVLRSQLGHIRPPDDWVHVDAGGDRADVLAKALKIVQRTFRSSRS